MVLADSHIFFGKHLMPDFLCPGFTCGYKCNLPISGLGGGLRGRGVPTESALY